MSRDVFVYEFCAMRNKAERWLKDRKREFGEKLCQRSSWIRVETYLFTQAARVPMLACTRAGIPLHGLSDEQPGIDRCRLLYKELQAAREASQKAEPNRSEPSNGVAPSSGSAPNDGFAPMAVEKIEVEVNGAEDADPGTQVK